MDLSVSKFYCAMYYEKSFYPKIMLKWKAITIILKKRKKEVNFNVIKKKSKKIAHLGYIWQG